MCWTGLSPLSYGGGGTSLYNPLIWVWLQCEQVLNKNPGLLTLLIQPGYRAGLNLGWSIPGFGMKGVLARLDQRSTKKGWSKKEKIYKNIKNVNICCQNPPLSIKAQAKIVSPPIHVAQVVQRTLRVIKADKKLAPKILCIWLIDGKKKYSCIPNGSAITLAIAPQYCSYT